MQLVQALHSLGLPTATLARLINVEESELRRVAVGHAVLDLLTTISLVAFAVRWRDDLEQFAANSCDISKRLTIATPMIERAQRELLYELTGLNREAQLVVTRWVLSWDEFLDWVFSKLEDTELKTIPSCPRVLH